MNLTNNNTSLGIRIIFYTIAFSPLLLLAFAMQVDSSLVGGVEITRNLRLPLKQN